jgi:hypothetical protein
MILKGESIDRETFGGSFLGLQNGGVYEGGGKKYPAIF